MTPHCALATAVLAAVLAVGACGSPPGRHAESAGGGKPLVAVANDAPPRSGHATDGTSESRPGPDGAARSPHPQPAGGQAGNRAVVEPSAGNPKLPSWDENTHRPSTAAPDLPTPGERTAARPQGDDVAASIPQDDPSAAAADIIETGLVDQGLEVHDVTAELIEQAGETATVRVTALHRLNGPPRQSRYELDLERDAGTWTVVANRLLQP